jgi:RNA polymerase sigma-70 factor (ECF subfamily)
VNDFMTGPNVKHSEDLETSVRLIGSAKASDPLAWTRLVALYTPLLRRWAACLGVSASDQDDLVQDVLACVHRKLGDFRRENPSQCFRAWLRTITRNKVIDYHRSRKRDGAAEHREPALALCDDSDDAADVDQAELSSERQMLYERAVAILQSEFRESTWRLFWQVVVEGAAPADVAAANGVQLNAVYLAKSRVLKRLREEFVGLIEQVTLE